LEGNKREEGRPDIQTLEMVKTTEKGKTRRNIQPCRFNTQERSFLEDVMDMAVVQVREKDLTRCVAFTMQAILKDNILHARATTLLREKVMDLLKTQGTRILRRMMLRHETFTKLPNPLRGNALATKAKELGLRPRSKGARVDATILREEIEHAPTRKRLKMHSDISRESTQNMSMKMKQRHCIQSILEKARVTGVSDITPMGSDFHNSNERCRIVALAAIEAAAGQKHVHVLDIHGLTVLFDFPVFQKVLELLERSYVFAINMGEDSGKLDRHHFTLLASKILDGSSAVRRWYVESNKVRRTTLVECGLVSAPKTKNKQTMNKGNVFTLARNADRALW
jgi:hypothetical protein